MPYLTYEEYKEFGYSDIKQDEFENLIQRACDYLDIQTRNFYQFNDLETDIDFRKTKFKKAVALQVEYMYQTGATTAFEINTPQSWSVDGMSVSESSRYNASGTNESPSIISDDTLAMLSGTGLLFRGLGQ